MESFSFLPPRSHLSALPCSSLSETFSRNRRLRLLIATTRPSDISWAQALIVRLSKNPHIEMRAIVDDVDPQLMQTIIVIENRGLAPGQGERAEDVEYFRQQAIELVKWADLLVCVPLDATGIAGMLAGIADTFLGEVHRGWNIQKDIVLVPGMSTHMWSNIATKRQLSKIQRKWNCIRVMTPILWHYEDQTDPKRIPSWNGFNEVLGIVKTEADLFGLGRDVEIAAKATMVTDNKV